MPIEEAIPLIINPLLDTTFFLETLWRSKKKTFKGHSSIKVEYQALAGTSFSYAKQIYSYKGKLK